MCCQSPLGGPNGRAGSTSVVLIPARREPLRQSTSGNGPAAAAHLGEMHKPAAPEVCITAIDRKAPGCVQSGIARPTSPSAAFASQPGRWHMLQALEQRSTARVPSVARGGRRTSPGSCMKVLISADGEGVSGITSSEELVRGKPDYQRFQHLMTADVNAAIEGAFAGGATEVVVNDAHWGMNNILIEELDPRADLVRGFHKPLCMMHGVDDGIDTIFCVGYHAMVGHSDGVANETMIGREMVEIRLNGRPVGELDINATLAAHYGKAISLVTGDDAFVSEARAALGDVEASVTKYALDRWTARCIGLDRSRASIRAAAERAVRRARDFTPLALPSPLTYEVEFTSTSEALMGALVPGAKRVRPRVVAYSGRDALEAWRGLFSVILLGWSATDEVYG